MRTLNAAIIAVLLACSTLTACGALPAIVAVAAIVNEAITWINVIADFVRAQQLPSDTQTKINQAVSRARIAAAAVQHFASGAQGVDAGDAKIAMIEFRAAYQALLDLAAPLGVRQASPPGVMGAPLGVSSGKLTVPRAADFGGPAS